MKIAVIGSINIDMVVTVDRIPLKGETLKGRDIFYSAGGKGANQAVCMAKLGAEVEMFGCVGDDEQGVSMVNNLREFGIKTDNIKVLKGVPTGIAIISVGESDNTIIVVAGANEKVDRDYFDSIKDKVLDYDMVVLQCEIPLDTIIYIIDYCHKNNIKVILNPAPATDIPIDTIEKVEHIIPNETEAKLIFKEDNIEDILKKYPEKLIVTMGSKGVCTYLEEEAIYNVEPRKTEVVDTTGAGDTLNGAFAVKIAGGEGIKEALRYANICASLSIEKFGAQSGMPTKEEVEEVIKRENL